MRRLTDNWTALFLLLFGAVFLTIGVAVGTLAAGQARAAAERVERLSPLGAVALRGP